MWAGLRTFPPKHLPSLLHFDAPVTLSPSHSLPIRCATRWTPPHRPAPARCVWWTRTAAWSLTWPRPTTSRWGHSVVMIRCCVLLRCCGVAPVSLGLLLLKVRGAYGLPPPRRAGRRPSHRLSLLPKAQTASTRLFPPHPPPLHLLLHPQAEHATQHWGLVEAARVVYCTGFFITGGAEGGRGGGGGRGGEGGGEAERRRALFTAADSSSRVGKEGRCEEAGGGREGGLRC